MAIQNRAVCFFSLESHLLEAMYIFISFKRGRTVTCDYNGAGRTHYRYIFLSRPVLSYGVKCKQLISRDSITFYGLFDNYLLLFDSNCRMTILRTQEAEIPKN